MLEFEQVTKKYGDRTAVRDLTFRAEAGEILGLLGPNGAGKTTTLRLLTSYLLPTEGRVRVFGYDTATHSLEVRKRIGYLPEEPPVYPEMTVREYLGFVAGAKGLGARERKPEVERVMSRVGLEEVAGRLIGNLSRGYRQRVGLGQALIGDPELLVLDEPTVGLDPTQIIEIRSLIKDLAHNRTVILSSHILPEVQAICSRVIILNRGQIVAQDTPDILSRRVQGGWRYVLEVDGPPPQVEEVLRRVPGVEEVRFVRDELRGRERYEVSSGDTDVRREMFFALAEARLPVLRLEPQEMTLEEIFLHLVTEETGEPEEEELTEETEEEEEEESWA